MFKWFATLKQNMSTFFLFKTMVTNGQPFCMEIQMSLANRKTPIFFPNYFGRIFKNSLIFRPRAAHNLSNYWQFKHHFSGPDGVFWLFKYLERKLLGKSPKTLSRCSSVLSVGNAYDRLKTFSQKTHLLWKEKYPCTDDLLFVQFGFGNKLSTDLHVCLNQNQ